MNPRPKRGDVVLFKGDGPISKIISFFTRSRYTHAALAIDDDHVIESDWGGVQINALSVKYESADYDVFRHKAATKESLDQAVKWALSRVRSGYDYLGLAGILFHYLGSMEYYDKNSLDDKSRYWCSELVVDAYHRACVQIEFDFDTWRVSPGDISKSGWLKKCI